MFSLILWRLSDYERATQTCPAYRQKTRVSRHRVVSGVREVALHWHTIRETNLIKTITRRSVTHVQQFSYFMDNRDFSCSSTILPSSPRRIQELISCDCSTEESYKRSISNDGWCIQWWHSVRRCKSPRDLLSLGTKRDLSLSVSTKRIGIYTSSDYIKCPSIKYWIGTYSKRILFIGNGHFITLSLILIISAVMHIILYPSTFRSQDQMKSSTCLIEIPSRSYRKRRAFQVVDQTAMLSVYVYT